MCFTIAGKYAVVATQHQKRSIAKLFWIYLSSMGHRSKFSNILPFSHFERWRAIAHYLLLELSLGADGWLENDSNKP